VYMARKRILPTHLGTDGLRQLSAEVREQSFFSARNFYEDVLGTAQTALESILEPKQVRRPDRVTAENPEGWVTEGFNPATARVAIKEQLVRAGYEPEEGEEGTIKDLSSYQRLKLVVETNEKLAHGKGMKIQGESPTLGRLWPAWELYRQEDRAKRRDWLSRFILAGQLSGRELGDGWSVEDGRMIALKGHPIWEQLGDSTNFDDGLDVSYPPFAFNSGMWVRPVDRETCQALGIEGRGSRDEGQA
jgi:hypothetical protein